MKSNERNIWILSAAVFIAGAGLLLHALLQTSAAKDHLRRRVEDLGQLQVYADTLQATRQARTRLHQEAAPRPERLATVAASLLDARSFDVLRLASRDIDPEWRLQRAELTFRNVDWEKLDAFLAQAESQRPPWILESGEIDAGTPGSGSGRLTLQALERIAQ